MSQDNSSEKKPIDGLKSAANILKHLSPEDSKTLLDSMQSKNPQVAERLKAQMFTFEDIAKLDDLIVQEIIKQTPPATLKLALYNTSAGVTQKFFSNLPQKAATLLKEDIQALGGQIQPKAVREAKKQIVTIAESLAQEKML